MSTTTVSKGALKERNFIPLKNLRMEDYDMLQDLIRFESISKKEDKVAAYVKEALIELGFTVTRDSMGNVYGERGDADEYALLNAHLDIVNLLSKYGYFNKDTKESYNKSYSSYDSLAFDTYSYDSYLSKEIQDVKAMKLSKQSKTSINIEDLSDDEAIEVWEEDAKEIKNLFGEEFKMVGFKCANCVNSCKAFKLCYYFEPNATIETKKVYLKYKRELEAEKINDEAQNDAEFIQESFNLEGRFVKLNKVEKKESSKSKNQKYLIKVDLIEDKITGSGKKRVLGGDDKCGIFIALKVAETLRDMPMKVLFTVQEETGCNGVKFFVKNNAEWLEDVKYSLTIDRRDYCHLLWSQRGVRSCSDNFAAEVMYQGIRAGIPVKLEDGGSADVVTLRDYVPNAINMSAGYYKAHTSDEYIVPSQVDKIVGWVKNIVQNI